MKMVRIRLCRTLGLLVLLLASTGADAVEAAAGRVATAKPAIPAGSGLELIVLGSGGPGATGRASSSFIVMLDGVPRILVDAGSGSFARIGELHLALDRLDLVLLTHLHIDHSAELPGILKARAVGGGRPPRIDVYGPARAGRFPSTRHFIDLLFGAHGAYAYLADFAATLDISAHDLDAVPRAGLQPQVLLAREGLKVSAIAGHHDDAPAIIYRIDYHDRSIVFSGDIDALGLADLRRIAAHCSLLAFNTVVLDPPLSPAPLYRLHTPPAAIGDVAATLQAGALLLVHLNPAIDAANDAVLASIRQRYAGPVTFAQDGQRLTP